MIIIINNNMKNFPVPEFKSGYQCNLFLFYPFCIIKAIFNHLNLRLSKKVTQLDTFLNNLCSSMQSSVLIFFCLFQRRKISTNFAMAKNGSIPKESENVQFQWNTHLVKKDLKQDRYMKCKETKKSINVISIIFYH